MEQIIAFAGSIIGFVLIAEFTRFIISLVSRRKNNDKT